MRKKYFHSTLNRALRSNSGTQMTNRMELASVPSPCIFKCAGAVYLTFSMQGPGVIAGTMVSVEDTVSGI